MSKFKYDSGEWKIRKTVDNSGDYPFPTYDIISIKPWGPTGLACAYQNPYNARIMACAPEMLDALIEHCNRFKILYKQDWKSFIEIEKIIKIIEKATGMTIDEILS